MKFFRYLSAALVALLCSTAIYAADAGKLNVHVSGIRNSNGTVRIALFNSQQAYNVKEGSQYAYRRAILPIKAGTADWALSDVPYGVYAIELFHDEDNSGKLKKTLVGRPTEGVGFSNNPTMNNHKPSFDEVKFMVSQPQTAISIKMINPSK